MKRTLCSSNIPSLGALTIAAVVAISGPAHAGGWHGGYRYNAYPYHSSYGCSPSFGYGSDYIIVQPYYGGGYYGGGHNGRGYYDAGYYRSGYADGYYRRAYYGGYRYYSRGYYGRARYGGYPRVGRYSRWQ